MINYNLIAESIQFYEKMGFSRIESPWTVSEYTDKKGNVYEFKDDQESWLGVCIICHLATPCFKKINIKCHSDDRKDKRDGYFIKKINKEE